MIDDYRKRLDAVGATISRLAGNSFQLKGWSVGLGSAIIGLLRSGPPVAAAFFIGGMDGVEQEYEAVNELSYEVPCYPVATTGAAAAILWNRLEAQGASSREPEPG